MPVRADHISELIRGINNVTAKKNSNIESSKKAATEHRSRGTSIAFGSFRNKVARNDVGHHRRQD
jgi:hypothetical protein